MESQRIGTTGTTSNVGVTSERISSNFNRADLDRRPLDREREFISGDRDWDRGETRYAEPARYSNARYSDFGSSGINRDREFTTYWRDESRFISGRDDRYGGFREGGLGTSAPLGASGFAARTTTVPGREMYWIEENPNAGCRRVGTEVRIRREEPVRYVERPVERVVERPVYIETPVYVERFIERPAPVMAAYDEGEGIGQHARTRHGAHGWTHPDHLRELSKEEWQYEHGQSRHHGPGFYPAGAPTTGYYGSSLGGRGYETTPSPSRGGFLGKLFGRGGYHPSQPMATYPEQYHYATPTYVERRY
eukprot:GEZU01006204.1.p1 GENE.GEZU01006204.1~~GEZU01006204.1.p1  ORF type:complete len:307 (-),score=35.82 GEZU01006204.1:65-985(-)